LILSGWLTILKRVKKEKLKKKVAIDIGPLTSGHKVRGIGAHTRELISEFKKIKSKEIKIEAIDFEKADLSKYDLVHYPDFNPYFSILPLTKPARTVITIHDLIPLIYPKHYPPGLKGSLRFFIQKFLANKQDAIITISETSKKDIVRFLGVHQDKVHVIHLAPREIIRKLTGSKLARVRKKYNLPKRFVLYVGDVNYNKNIPGLMKACEIAKVPLVICGKQARDFEERGMGLDVLTGPKDWFRFLFNIPHPELAHYKEILKHFQESKKIYYLGFVPDEDLVAIYNLASVYCQPSFYEGFGLPLLEAMAAGCPVVASKIQALVEIAEDAALFADPKDPKDMAKKITEILKNAKAREQLVKKGEKRVKNFSWTKTTKKTLRVYEQILQK